MAAEIEILCKTIFQIPNGKVNNEYTVEYSTVSNI